MSDETRPTVMPDPVESAEAAGLCYVSDTQPGITRERVGEAFRYRGSNGAIITAAATLARIRSLGIPPAWEAVWICPDPRGHLQATGRDAKGRKQYRYHPRWRAVRDETKYGRMLAFGQALPAIRAQVAKDLQRPGLPREKVLATLVRLLETTYIRIGNEEYARQNESYGLTTLRGDHVDVRGDTLRFHFRGKSGKEHEIELHDRRVAAIVQRCQDLPGQEVFQYLAEDGSIQTVRSDDVNVYLREISGADFTAKDFRTWAGTMLTAQALRAAPAPGADSGPAKKAVAAAIAQTAARLGNTPSVCRKCYVHPAVLESYLDGTMPALLTPRRADDSADSGLSPDEAAVLRLLRAREGEAT
jgi:DNA topoisomerase-1